MRAASESKASSRKTARSGPRSAIPRTTSGVTDSAKHATSASASTESTSRPSMCSRVIGNDSSSPQSRSTWNNRSSPERSGLTLEARSSRPSCSVSSAVFSTSALLLLSTRRERKPRSSPTLTRPVLSPIPRAIRRIRSRERSAMFLRPMRPAAPRSGIGSGNWTITNRRSPPSSAFSFIVAAAEDPDPANKSMTRSSL